MFKEINILTVEPHSQGILFQMWKLRACSDHLDNERQTQYARV